MGEIPKSSQNNEYRSIDSRTDPSGLVAKHVPDSQSKSPRKTIDAIQVAVQPIIHQNTDSMKNGGRRMSGETHFNQIIPIPTEVRTTPTPTIQDEQPTIGYGDDCDEDDVLGFNNQTGPKRTSSPKSKYFINCKLNYYIQSNTFTLNNIYKKIPCYENIDSIIFIIMKNSL